MVDEVAKRRAVNASCEVPAADGSECSAPAMKGTTYCLFHSPVPADQQRAHVARQVGMKLATLRGKHFRVGALETPDDWLGAIAGLVNDLVQQPNGPQRVQAFGVLSREAREWFTLSEMLRGNVIEAGDA